MGFFETKKSHTHEPLYDSTYTNHRIKGLKNIYSNSVYLYTLLFWGKILKFFNGNIYRLSTFPLLKLHILLRTHYTFSQFALQQRIFCSENILLRSFDPILWSYSSGWLQSFCHNSHCFATEGTFNFSKLGLLLFITRRAQSKESWFLSNFPPFQ